MNLSHVQYRGDAEKLPRHPLLVTENNAANLVLQLRRLADQAEGTTRSELRNLAVEQERIARRISELA